MKNLLEKKEALATFWEHEDDGLRDKLIQEIRAYTESTSPADIISEIRLHFEQLNFSGISVLYEALSDNPQKWSQFFKEEYQRAFEAAAQADNPFEILECLDEINFVDAQQLESRDEIIRLLEEYLDHEKAALRYKAVWYLGDWILEDNMEQYGTLVQKIIGKLQDPNWKTRYITQLVLDDVNQLPKDYKPRFLDGLLAKISSPFNMNKSYEKRPEKPIYRLTFSWLAK
ncbi:MAG: hypothetical protein R2792_20100 [Saprospiraceae bacterium]